MPVENVDSRERPIRRVVIAGGGTAGWMAAAGLSRGLGKAVEIVLVESEEIGTIGVGEATIPPLMTFHRLLEINEQEFMAATQATIKLGIQFEGWRDIGHRYFHSFGATGKDHWMANFVSFWLRGRREGMAEDYDQYCVELLAALENRFAHLPRNGINYAYHLDAGLYAKFLRNFAEKFGAKRIEGKIVEVQTEQASGWITGLRLANGALVEGDLFIDCTGFRALLIEKTMNVGFDDWSHWLLNDRAFAAPTATQRDAIPYTRSIACKAGWQWRIPLQHRVGNGIVYSSRYLSDDEAREEFVSSLESPPLRDPLHIRFRPGKRHKSWHRNCIALGLSASFIEPLESTTIHLIQRGIVHLLQAFPQVVTPQIVAQYNARLDDEIEHVRDFVILHYHATDRRDSPYWRTVAGMEIPVSLRHRIELFRETGNVYHVPLELFAENSWIQVMMGQGIEPKRYHPVADVMSLPDLRRFLDDIRTRTRGAVDSLPQHMDYLRGYAPAAKA
jgi:tryptophan halogenase